MEPIVAVMLMLGCDDSMMVCRQMNEPAHQFTSVEACETAIDTRIRQIDGFPMAVADCIEVSGIARGVEVSIDWRIDRTGGLHAQAVVEESGPIFADASLVVASSERF